MKKIILAIVWVLSLCVSSCRQDDEIIPEVLTPVETPDTTMVDPVTKRRLLGFYLLNEGNMGSNKSTLDYMDLITGNYHRNIFAAANPGVPMELGDVGNDIGIYGSKLYAVINCSNKVEVMDKFTAKRLGKIDIPNCRYIKFHGGYAYVTSYAGPVRIGPEYEQIGYVAKVDTATFEVVAQCLVGFQPDELEIVSNKIYVANSGGYMAPSYENEVSVIDIASFEEIGRIPVAANLHRLEADRHGNLWASSRGDYFDTLSRLFWMDTKTDTYGGSLDLPTSEMTLDGDSLYIYSTEWSYTGYDWGITFGIVDVAKKEIVTRNFITDGTDKQITMPYGILVNPINKDIYMTNAADFVHPGMLYCFDRHGKQKWKVPTGDIPAHFVLLWK